MSSVNEGARVEAVRMEALSAPRGGIVSLLWSSMHGGVSSAELSCWVDTHALSSRRATLRLWQRYKHFSTLHRIDWKVFVLCVVVIVGGDVEAP